jgi:hypothetical protein
MGNSVTADVRHSCKIIVLQDNILEERFHFNASKPEVKDTETKCTISGENTLF